METLYMRDLSEEDTAIEFRNITKKFGFLTAVNNLSLKIKKGDVVGFLGPNGAGKTTTIKLLANLIHPQRGDCDIKVATDKGLESIYKNPRRILKKVGFLIDIPYFYADMTCEQVLMYFARLKDYPENKIPGRIDKLLGMTEMLEWKDNKMKTFSKGMTQKIGIVQAIIHDPEIVVLDEPQGGLDPIATLQIRNLIRDLQKEGKTIFLSSHMLKEISEVANKLALIYKGNLLGYDSLSNLESFLQGSEIDFDLLNPLDQDLYEKIIPRLDNELKPYCGENRSKLTKLRLQYIPTIPAIRIFFDGKPESRHEIIRIMANTPEIKITSAFTDSSARLEKLYVDMMGNAANNAKNDISVRRVF